MRFWRKIRRSTIPFCLRATKLWRRGVFEGGAPAGIFSDEERIRREMNSGKIVFDGQTMPPIPEDSEIRKAGLGQERYQGWVSVWTRWDHSFLAAPSLPHLDAFGKASLEAVYGPHAWDDPVWKRKSAYSVRNLSGDHTSLVSRWNTGKNYYHWFLDGLTRLIHLPEFPPNCRIIVPQDLAAFAGRSLQMLGLSDRLVETADEDLRIERYWFAGPTMLSGCPDPAGVQWLREKFGAGTTEFSKRLIYIERNAPTRKLANAYEVSAFFKERGWECIDPSDLTLDGQIELFREAKAVAGVHGAALTNLLWTAPGTPIVEFMPSQRRNGCYAAISHLAGLKHQTLVFPSNRKGEMRIPIEILDSMLPPVERDN